MRSFEQPCELCCWDQSDVSRPPTPDDYNFLIVDYAIKNRGEFFAKACVCSFGRHRDSYLHRTAFLYVLLSGWNRLDVQVADVQRVIFDKLPAALHVLAHQR